MYSLSQRYYYSTLWIKRAPLLSFHESCLPVSRVLNNAPNTHTHNKDAADREVLSSMREHARGRQKQRGAAAPLSRSRTSSPQRQQRQHPRANGGNAAAPTEVLRERVLAVSGSRTSLNTTRECIPVVCQWHWKWGKWQAYIRGGGGRGCARGASS